jgi:phosphatidylserine decarboxylase
MAGPLPHDAQGTNAKWQLPAVHADGRKFVVVALILAAFSWLIGPHTLFWPLVGLSLWVALFFRDPVRVVPVGDEFIVAPADGLVTLIQMVRPPRELTENGGLDDVAHTRVSIFMSIFDMHIQRAPITGVVRRVVYMSGRFLSADADNASEENERQHFLIERSDGVNVGFTQVAGLIARRILAFTKAGDMVAAGQRIGLIRFGSRVDVYLPAGVAARVAVGQRSVAGETILGVIGEATPARGIAQ